MKLSYKLFLITFLLIVIPSINAIPNDASNSIDFTYPEAPINFSIQAVNHSNSTDNWETNIGTLGNVNATQFENNGGTLSIITSWLISFGNNQWCKLTGCTMAGDIDMNSNEIHNLANLSLTQDINLYPFNWLVPLPTLNNHTANKEYVDSATSSTAFDFFFSNKSSDISGYFNMTDTDLELPTSELDSDTLGQGTFSIFNWTTEIGKPEFNELRQGVYDVHLHLKKSGTKPVTITPKLYNISSDGSVRTLLVTFESKIITTNIEDYEMHGILLEPVMLDNGVRLNLELEATIGQTGSNVFITAEMEGTTDSHLTIATSTNAFEKIFIRRDGSNTLIGNWNWDTPTNPFNINGSGNLTLNSLTDGSVLFIDNGGVVSEDTNFKYDPTTQTMSIQDAEFMGDTDWRIKRNGVTFIESFGAGAWQTYKQLRFRNNVLLTFGNSGQVQQRWSGFNLIVDAVIGSPNYTFTNFNQVQVVGDLNVTGNINVGNNVTLDSGAVFWSNSTCAFISSPSGTNVLEVCD